MFIFTCYCSCDEIQINIIFTVKLCRFFCRLTLKISGKSRSVKSLKLLLLLIIIGLYYKDSSMDLLNRLSIYLEVKSLKLCYWLGIIAATRYYNLEFNNRASLIPSCSENASVSHCYLYSKEDHQNIRMLLSNFSSL